MANLEPKEELRVYESLDELANHFRQFPSHFRNTQDRWFAGDYFDDALQYLSSDFDRNKAEIDRIIEEMDTQDIFTTGLPMPQRSYYGSKPNVAAYLAGLPKNMMRRVPDEQTSIATPISIYIDALVSADVSENVIRARGIAVCALAMALKTFRPVSVYIISAMHYRGLTKCIKVQVSENTFDLGRMDFCFSTKEYARRLMFSEFNEMMGYNTNTINWGWHSSPTASLYVENSKRVFGIGPDDIYIKGGYLHDDGFMRSPVEWVKMMLEKHKHIETEE